MKIVTVGNQTWALENVINPVFRNGDEIPIVDNFSDWSKYSSDGKPCCAYVDNKSSMKKYGLIFNGFSLIDSRNIAPLGFRVPRISDIIELTTYLKFPNLSENSIYYNGNAALVLKSSDTWKKSFVGMPGNNETGMSFLAGGNLGIRSGNFNFIDKGTTASHWLLDEYIPKEGVRFLPAPPENWPKNQNYCFNIGIGGDHSLSIKNEFLFGARFIRLIEE
ncbi:FISUMP domain-containing protein [Aquirufa sp. ROCK2-A2]